MSGSGLGPGNEGEREQGQQQNQEATRDAEEFHCETPFLYVEGDETKGTMDKSQSNRVAREVPGVHLSCTCEYASLAHSPLAVRLSCIAFKSARRRSYLP